MGSVISEMAINVELTSHGCQQVTHFTHGLAATISAYYLYDVRLGFVRSRDVNVYWGDSQCPVDENPAVVHVNAMYF
jgi:hypothetical protein